MNLEQLKKDCIKKKERYPFYSCVNSNMDYGFNGTINKFSYINKKSINILLYSTIIANIVFNIQNIENTISR